MRKTTVYLGDVEASALRRLSRSVGVSQSILLRKGVRLVFEAAEQGTLGRHPPIPARLLDRTAIPTEDAIGGDLGGDDLQLPARCDEPLRAGELRLLAYLASGWSVRDIARAAGESTEAVVDAAGAILAKTPGLDVADLTAALEE